MRKPIVLVFQGLPGLGKSTILKRLLKTVPGLEIISLDQIRGLINGNQAIQGNIDLVLGYARRRLCMALERGMDVAIDATTVARAHYDAWGVVAAPYTDSLILCALRPDNELDVSLERNRERQQRGERYVPEDVLHAMSATLRGFDYDGVAVVRIDRPEGFTAVLERLRR